MKTNRYSQIIEKIFFTHHRAGERIFSFAREEIEQVAAGLGIKLPKNVGASLFRVGENSYSLGQPRNRFASCPPAWRLRARTAFPSKPHRQAVIMGLRWESCSFPNASDSSVILADPRPWATHTKQRRPRMWAM